MAEIAKETRIGSRHLEAIETGDTRTMPRDFFYRSFVRQYSKFLGLEGKEIETGLDLEMGTPAPPMAMAAAASAVARSSSAVRPAPAAAARPLRIAAPPQAGPQAATADAHFSPRAFLQESRTSAPWLVLAGLLLVAAVSYLSWERVSNAATTAAKLPSSASSAVETVRHDAKEQPAAPSVTATSANGTIVEATKLASGSLKLIISAKEPAWIQLDADGKALFVGLLEAGQSQEVDNAQQAKLLTGNAGGIEVLQNGKPVTGLGMRGEVRTVVFSPGDYQVIRPAVPKMETPAPETKREAPKSDTSPVAE